MSKIREKKKKAVFYKDQNGNEPAREQLRKLTAEYKKKIGETIQYIEFNWKCTEPHMKTITGANSPKTLYEARTRIKGTWHRVLFFIDGKYMVLLSYVQKKGNSLAKGEIKLAVDRLKDYIKRK